MTLSTKDFMSTSDAFDLSGRTLDDFRILRKLGQGGMGQVYLAEQISLKRKVALKILPPDQATLRPDALTRFKAEAEAVARAVHPHILQVYAYGEVEGMPYMALEYVEGRNLKEDVALKGPPEEGKAIRIMRQVASALQRASELGIIHRDIKPENILIARTGEVKVADFGLARCHTDGESVLKLTQSGVTMGTPLYMSPEQLEGKPLDSRTDIYSLGATSYHMLSGGPPFRGETALAVALQHLNQEPPPLAASRPDLPGQLCAIVHKMMAKEPSDRYQTARDVMRELARLRPGFDDVSDDDDGAAVSVPLAPKLGEAPTKTQMVPLRRRWVLVILAVLSVLAAGGLGAGLSWWKYRARDVSPAEDRAVPLRDAIEQAGDDANAQLMANMNLGLFYLEQDRLDEAQTFFANLEQNEKRSTLKSLGLLGQGVVLALQDKQEESNGFFIKACRNPENLKTILADPQWRVWIGRARWFNKMNDLPDKKVPAVLASFPVTTAQPKKEAKPTQPDKIKR